MRPGNYLFEFLQRRTDARLDLAGAIRNYIESKNSHPLGEHVTGFKPPIWWDKKVLLLVTNRKHMKTYCFGDSFIGMFTLVKNFRVFKFKGATAKGLSKKDSPNRDKILSVISGLNNYTRRNSCFLFQFGSVDIHHSYFYKIVSDETFNPDDIEGFVNPIVDGYVDFIDELECDKKIILTPHYSPIEDKDVILSLIKYGIISQDHMDKIVHYTTREYRNRLVDTFCDRVISQAPTRGIAVVDLRAEVARDGIILPEFIDQSATNIHLIWEALLAVYSRFLRRCGVTKDQIDFSKYPEYVEEKRQRLSRNI